MFQFTKFKDWYHSNKKYLQNLENKKKEKKENKKRKKGSKKNAPWYPKSSFFW